MEFCTCLIPFISLTSSLKLTWLHFSHYFTCIHRAQCPSYCAWQSVPVLWRKHLMWHILQMPLSSLVTWCSWWLHGMLSTFIGCASCLILRDQASDFRTSDHHLLSATGSPVTPYAPPSSLTTVFACSRAWSIIIGENYRLDLCTITFPFRTSEPSEVVSVKSYCLCRRQKYIVHNLNCLWQMRMVSVRSVTDSTDWSLPSRILGWTRGLLYKAALQRAASCYLVHLAVASALSPLSASSAFVKPTMIQSMRSLCFSSWTLLPVSVECTRFRWFSFWHLYGQFNQDHSFTTFRYGIRPKSHFPWLCSRSHTVYSGADI